jgi:hypothetical protein
MIPQGYGPSSRIGNADHRGKNGKEHNDIEDGAKLKQRKKITSNPGIIGKREKKIRKRKGKKGKQESFDIAGFALLAREVNWIGGSNGSESCIFHGFSVLSDYLAIRRKSL